MQGLLYLSVVGTVFGILVAMGCRSDKELERQRRERISEATGSATPADAAVDSTPADAAISALNLPRHDVDATKVIWSTLAEVRLVLGPGVVQKNGKWRHDLGDGEFVEVVYKDDRAVGIEMPTANAGWDHFDERQRNAMETWAHLRHGEQVRRHDVIAGDGLPATGDGFPVTGLAVYEKEYWKREIAKVAAQIDAKRAAEVQADKEARVADAKADEVRAKREKIVETFARLFKSGEAKVSSAGAALVIDGPVEVCSGRVLARLRQRFAALKLDQVFDEMNCGEMGDAIDLHTTTGCKPDQRDQLILTDAGERRNAFSEGLEGLIWEGLVVVATGCDATVLGIALMSGFDVTCDAQRLASVRRQAGAQLRRVGFTTIRCEPNGPELPIK